MIKKVVKKCGDISYTEYEGESLYLRMQECLMDKECAFKTPTANTGLKNDFFFAIRSRHRYSEFLIVRYRFDIGLETEVIDILYPDNDIVMRLSDYGKNIEKAINKIKKAKTITTSKLNSLCKSILSNTKHKKELNNDFNYSKLEQVLRKYKPLTDVLMVYKIWA